MAKSQKSYHANKCWHSQSLPAQQINRKIQNFHSTPWPSVTWPPSSRSSNAEPASESVKWTHVHYKSTNSCDNCKSHKMALNTSWSDPRVGGDPSILTQPAPVQVHWHEDRRNGEEVHHRVHLQPEPQLVVGSNKLFHKINNNEKKKIKKKKKRENDHGWRSELQWTHNFWSFAYTKAKVEQEEDVERHVDLQSEVLVEVLTGLDRTVRGRDTGKKTQ